MTSAYADKSLRDLISSVVRKRLNSVHVEDVLVSRDEGEEDDVLSVTIIIDNADADIDDDDVLALVSDIQPRLEEARETAFPVISFSTARELEATA